MTDFLRLFAELLKSIATLLWVIFVGLGAVGKLLIGKAQDINAHSAHKRRPVTLATDVAALIRSLELRVSAANFPSKDKLREVLIDRFTDYEPLKHPGKYPSKVIWHAYFDIAWTLLEREKPPIPALATDQISLGRQADELMNECERFKHPEPMLEEFYEALAKSWALFMNQLPLQALTVDSEYNEPPYLGTLPLLDLIRNPREVVHEILAPLFLPEPRKYKLFQSVADLMIRKEEMLKLPHFDDFKGTNLEVVDAYLSETPFRKLFDLFIPFSIKTETRLSHWHVIATTGWGKTQTLQHIIHHDLLSPEAPALVIIEPKGDMAKNILRLKHFADKHERVAYIDPDLSPSLNLFARPSEARIYSQAQKEQIEASINSGYAYIFSALEADISRNQAVAMAYIVKLLLQRNGGLDDFMKIVSDSAKTLKDSDLKDDVNKLDEHSQDFFRNYFFTGTLPISRRALGMKLHGLVAIDVFRRMFAAKRNCLDIFQRLNTPGSITIVNTSQGTLQKEGSTLLGRFMISQVMTATFERAALPLNKRRPAFLIIDEAGDYLDDNIERMLVQARSMGVGVLFAHHTLEQLKGASLKSAAMSMPAIRFAVPSDTDATAIATAMRTSVAFLRSAMKIEGKATQYGVYVRGETTEALRVQFPFFTMENAPQMTEEEYEALMTSIRARYSDENRQLTTTKALPSAIPDEQEF